MALCTSIVAAMTFAPFAAPPQLDCVQIHSPSKLSAGSTFTARIQHGLEFRLSKDWDISVGPTTDHTPDYPWLVSPPLRPRRIEVRQRLRLYGRRIREAQSSLHFVLNQQDYDAATAAIDLRDGRNAEAPRRASRDSSFYLDNFELKGDDFK